MKFLADMEVLFGGIRVYCEQVSDDDSLMIDEFFDSLFVAHNLGSVRLDYKPKRIAIIYVRTDPDNNVFITALANYVKCEVRISDEIGREFFYRNKLK